MNDIKFQRCHRLLNGSIIARFVLLQDRQLGPIVKQTVQLKKTASLQVEKLKIDGQTFTVRIPPKTTKEVGNGTAFYTALAPLSNYFSTKLVKRLR